MDRYGASTRDYERNDDSDNYCPRRTGGTGGVRSNGTRRRVHTPDSLDSDIEHLRREVRDEEARHSGPRGDYTTDEDDFQLPQRSTTRGGAGGARTRNGNVNGGTRRRRDDSDIENLRREVREEEARYSSGPHGGYCDDHDEFELPRRSTIRGVSGRGGNGGTRRRRDDSDLENLRREVREEEARHSGPRGHYPDDSEGETEFGRRLERESIFGRRGHGAGTRSVMPPSRGHHDSSDDDGMSRGRRGAFCGSRPS